VGGHSAGKLLARHCGIAATDVIVLPSEAHFAWEVRFKALGARGVVYLTVHLRQVVL